MDKILLKTGHKHNSSFEHKAHKMHQKPMDYVKRSEVSRHMSSVTKAQAQFAKAAQFGKIKIG